jgi:hypothetical protein
MKMNEAIDPEVIGEPAVYSSPEDYEQNNGTLAKSLAADEAIIYKGLNTFVEVGLALARIKDGKKYRAAGFSTFKEYCQESWDMSNPRAYQIISASEVVKKMSTNVDILPNSEAQVRPLLKIKDPVKQRIAWQKAVETAPNGKPTQKHVASIVATHLPPSKPSKGNVKANPIKPKPKIDLGQSDDEYGDQLVLEWDFDLFHDALNILSALVDAHREQGHPGYTQAAMCCLMEYLLDAASEGWEEDEEEMEETKNTV